MSTTDDPAVKASLAAEAEHAVEASVNPVAELVAIMDRVSRQYAADCATARVRATRAGQLDAIAYELNKLGYAQLTNGALTTEYAVQDPWGKRHDVESMQKGKEVVDRSEVDAVVLMVREVTPWRLSYRYTNADNPEVLETSDGTVIRPDAE